jgi:hypothetical protein
LDTDSNARPSHDAVFAIIAGRGLNIKIPEQCHWWNADPVPKSSAADTTFGVGGGGLGSTPGTGATRPMAATPATKRQIAVTPATAPNQRLYPSTPAAANAKPFSTTRRRSLPLETPVSSLGRNSSPAPATESRVRTGTVAREGGRGWDAASAGGATAPRLTPFRRAAMSGGLQGPSRESAQHTPPPRPSTRDPSRTTTCPPPPPPAQPPGEQTPREARAVDVTQQSVKRGSAGAQAGGGISLRSYSLNPQAQRDPPPPPSAAPTLSSNPNPPLSSRPKPQAPAPAGQGLLRPSTASLQGRRILKERAPRATVSTFKAVEARVGTRGHHEMGPASGRQGAARPSKLKSPGYTSSRSSGKRQ